MNDKLITKILIRGIDETHRDTIKEVEKLEDQRRWLLDEIEELKDRRNADQKNPAILCGEALLGYAMRYADQEFGIRGVRDPIALDGAMAAMKYRLPSTAWGAVVRWYVEKNMSEVDGAVYEPIVDPDGILIESSVMDRRAQRLGNCPVVIIAPRDANSGLCKALVSSVDEFIRAFPVAATDPDVLAEVKRYFYTDRRWVAVVHLADQKQ
jgi:hypothetical protein